MDFSDSSKLLENVLGFFYNLQIFPKIGIELEFYLGRSTSLLKIEELLRNIEPLIMIKSEIGHNQHEIVFPPSTDILAYIKIVERCRGELLDQECILDVMYKETCPPNALHLNLNFLKNNINLFKRDGNNYNLFLNYVIGGLCELMTESMCFFLPLAEDYLRLEVFDPKNVSWGANNRTTSLRLPENIPENLRIEQRLISPKADLTKVILVSLLSAYYGIGRKILPPEKIYGLAGKKLDVVLLPKSLNEALEIYHEKSNLRDLIKQFA